MQIEAHAAAGPRPQRPGFFEQRLYEASPFGLVGTTAAIFLVLLGAYAIAAALDHQPWVVIAKSGAALDRRAWVAVCLSLIVSAALGMQRYSWLADVRDMAAFDRALRNEVNWSPIFSAPRLRLLTLLGAAVGGGVMFVFLTRTAVGLGVGAGVRVWTDGMAALLGALFLRGLEMTRTGAQHTREVLRRGLVVDLLRIERLYPFGHAAARTATIWFTVSAATLLLLVGTPLGPGMLALSLASAAIGAWVFVGTLGEIRAAIRAAKGAELEQVRHQIAALKADLHADPAAPAKLQSLLAFEARIANVHEWPFDQTTLARVIASSLVLTIPWFGQAFAGALVQRFSSLIR